MAAWRLEGVKTNVSSVCASVCLFMIVPWRFGWCIYSLSMHVWLVQIVESVWDCFTERNSNWNRQRIFWNNWKAKHLDAFATVTPLFFLSDRKVTKKKFITTTFRVSNKVLFIKMNLKDLNVCHILQCPRCKCILSVFLKIYSRVLF